METLEDLIPDQTTYTAFSAKLKAALTNPNARVRESTLGRLQDDRTIGMVVGGYETEGQLFVSYIPAPGASQSTAYIGDVPDGKTAHDFTITRRIY